MVQVSYPGVYIEEIPSGVHTITGVATSVAAFVGWAAQGPTTQATLVQSWSDFERTFGGLDSRSNLGYAVSQFFGNGGQQAYIVRLVADGSNATTAAAPAAVVLNDSTNTAFLSVHASSAGLWGTHYGVVAKVSPFDATRFSLSVGYVPDLTNAAQYSIVESFPSLSVNPSDSRYVVNVINAESNYLTFTSTDIPPTFTIPAAVPAAFPTTLTMLVNGNDGTVLKPAPLYPADPSPPAAGVVTTFVNGIQASGGSGGVNLLTRVPIFNLLCVPGLSDTANTATIALLQTFCQNQRAFLIVDADQGATVSNYGTANGPNSSIIGSPAINSALYFPWVNAPDPLNQNRIRPYPPCGFIAGLYAATDSSRGVWKAPAGVDASLTGASGLTVTLTDAENGQLNPVAINCLRTFSAFGTIIWGARTLRGNDEAASEWKYVPVRRFALFLESSLYNGTQWVVFEPNAAPLWAQIRLSVGAFLQTLFRQGAFAGASAREAYFVKCDGQTTTQNDINNGVVNILVGFAPLLPAEFVVIQIQQMAGQVQT
jgi:Bacteriophage tail sheath protein